jgi:hypothetical protein
MRPTQLLLPLALLGALGSAGVASAAVKLRAAVRPDSVTQCGPAKAYVVLSNTGERTIRIHATLSLVDDVEATVLGPFTGYIDLAAGERRMREFRFVIPKDFPSLSYSWVVRALANDLTRDTARAGFVVTSGTCGDTPALPGGVSQEEEVMRGLGLEPEDATGAGDHSWGEIKKRYKDDEGG